MNKISRITDTIALFLTLAVFLYIVFSFFYGNILYRLILTSLTLFMLFILYCAVSGKKRKNDSLKRQDEKFCGDIFFNLAFYPQKDLRSFFSLLLEKAGFICESFGDLLIAGKDGKKKAVITCFDKKAVEADIFFCEQIRQEKNLSGFMLLCGECSEGAQKLLNPLNNENNLILTKNRLFKVMKKHNFYPEIKYKNVLRKKVLKEIFSAAFSRRRFKSFFFLALVMFLFSHITPFKTYYLVFSAALFLLSVITLLNKKTHTNTDGDLI